MLQGLNQPIELDISVVSVGEILLVGVFCAITLTSMLISVL